MDEHGRRAPPAASARRDRARLLIRESIDSVIALAGVIRADRTIPPALAADLVAFLTALNLRLHLIRSALEDRDAPNIH